MSDDDTNTPGGADIRALRKHLFEAIRSVRSGELELDKAREINELCKTVVSTGRLEVDHIRATEATSSSSFIAPEDDAASQAALPNGIAGIVRHRLGR